MICRLLPADSLLQSESFKSKTHSHTHSHSEAGEQPCKSARLAAPYLRRASSECGAVQPGCRRAAEEEEEAGRQQVEVGAVARRRASHDETL